jgi:hypothetical protein
MLTGWRAALFVGGILVIIVIFAFLAIGALVVIVPPVILGAVLSRVLPKPWIVRFRPTRRRAGDIIDAEYKVVEPSHLEQETGRSFDQLDGTR